MYGQLSTIEMLLDIAKGWSDDDLLNSPDKRGWTPLMVAAAYGEVGAVKLLLKLGASLHAVSAEGRTALHWAASKARNEVIPELLAPKEADPNIADNSGWT